MFRMCSSRFRFRLTFGFLCNLTSVPMAMALFILIFHHEMVPKASCDTLFQGAAMLVHCNDTHCTCDTVLRESSPRASKIAPSCVACASDSHKQSFNISCAATPSPLLHMQGTARGVSVGLPSMAIAPSQANSCYSQ